jgi:hypothetical protein
MPVIPVQTLEPSGSFLERSECATREIQGQG